MMTTTTEPQEWELGKLDLRAYLDRIGCAEPVAPTADALCRLQRAHIKAIPFENVDTMLDREVRLDMRSLQAKLVQRQRGGNCLEHNLLFAAALQRLGFPVRRLAARVFPARPNARTHMMLRVRVDGEPWLADAAYRSGLLEPIPMEHGTTAVQGGWTYALERTAAGPWFLRSLRPEVVSLYSFTLEPQLWADYEVINHWVTTHPHSPFTGQIVAMRRDEQALYTLRGRELTVTNPNGQRSQRTVRDGELAQVLRDTFGIHLDPTEQHNLRIDDAAPHKLSRRSTMRFRPSGQQDLAPAETAERVRANVSAVRTLKRLGAEQRSARGQEQAVLARWSGWGAVPEVFDESSPEYAAVRQQLRELLSESEYAEASRAMFNAHYTDAEFARRIWNALVELGVRDARVLEPGCGAGTFIGFAPADCQLVGIERDAMTAGIAQALYPDAEIRHESFAESPFPDASFDAAVGNVPFSPDVLHDPRHNQSGHGMYTHFLIKALSLTRPGGMVALLTSRYAMDDRDARARRELAELGDLVGAVRFPSHANRGPVSTDVVADLLVLRRREPGRAVDDTAWEAVREVEIEGQLLKVNEYFLQNPEMVMGKLCTRINSDGTADLVVEGSGDTPTDLSATLTTLTKRAIERGHIA